jgi:hypothetical protein
VLFSLTFFQFRQTFEQQKNCFKSLLFSEKQFPDIVDLIEIAKTNRLITSIVCLPSVDLFFTLASKSSFRIEATKKMPLDQIFISKFAGSNQGWLRQSVWLTMSDIYFGLDFERCECVFSTC